MNKTKCVFYEMNDMPSFIMEQLTAGILPAFFPVSFICEKDECLGIYQTEDYVPLETLEKLSAKLFLVLFCKLLAVLSDNEKHYLAGENYQITPQTFYVDLTMQEVRLIYVPNPNPCPVKKQLNDLLENGQKKVGETGQGYLKDMENYLKREEVGYHSAIHYGEQLQYELSICNIQ